MTQPRTILDDELFRQRLQAFLRTPAAAPVWEELSTSLGICLFGSALLLVIHTVQLFTIRWTLDGLKGLWQVLTLQNFKPMFEISRKHPERVHPLIAAGIIVGPDGKHALAVGSFQPSNTYSLDWLAQKAAGFADVYVEGATHASEEPLYELLRDDTYRPYRRRRLPDAYSDGVELYLFDVEVELAQSYPITDDCNLFSFAVTKPGPEGIIAMTPWAVADGALTVVETA
jgi:hypothetical protein